MEWAELVDKIQGIQNSDVEGRRTPEKALLILLALGHLQQNKPRLMPFSEIEAPLEELLEMFGRPGKPRPEHPFWHLRTAKFWEIPAEQSVPTQSGSAARKYLRDHNIEAGFTTETYNLIHSNPDLADELATTILQDHFTETLYRDILDMAGLAPLG